jgi:hypothetical protein
MKCTLCEEDEAVHIVEYKDSFFLEEICEVCFDKDQEEFELVFEQELEEDMLN